MRGFFACACLFVFVGAAYAWQWQSVGGSRRESLWQPPVYFVQSQIENENAAGGLYYGKRVLAFGEGKFQDENIALKTGYLAQSLDDGFLLSNGGWLPQYSSLATERPIGGMFSVQQGVVGATAAVYMKPNNEQTQIVKGGLKFDKFFTFQAGISGVQKSRFLYVEQHFYRSFFSSLTWLAPNQWQGVSWARIGRWSTGFMLFQNETPEIFQAEVFRTYKKMASFKVHHENFKVNYRNADDKQKLTAQASLLSAGIFHLQNSTGVSMTGLYYEDPSEGWHLLIHAYGSATSSLWQSALGLNYEKRVKFAVLTGFSEKFIPIDPVFWPIFYDSENMHDDNLLYYSGRFMGAEASVETEFFSFYALVLRTANPQGEVQTGLLFRAASTLIF